MLDPAKELVFTRHFTNKWRARIMSSATREETLVSGALVKELRTVISTGRYVLIDDGEERNGPKYRMVCRVAGDILTLVVIDARCLVLKTVWRAKRWEVRHYLEQSGTANGPAARDEEARP